MPKTQKKVNVVPDIYQELALMRYSIRAIKERMCEDLEAMNEMISRLIPPEDEGRYQRYKNFTKEQWGDFLDGKIT